MRMRFPQSGTKLGRFYKGMFPRILGGLVPRLVARARRGAPAEGKGTKLNVARWMRAAG